MMHRAALPLRVKVRRLTGALLIAVSLSTIGAVVVWASEGGYQPYPALCLLYSDPWTWEYWYFSCYLSPPPGGPW